MKIMRLSVLTVRVTVRKVSDVLRHVGHSNPSGGLTMMDAFRRRKGGNSQEATGSLGVRVRVRVRARASGI
jgi:hypothetical protein